MSDVGHEGRGGEGGGVQRREEVLKGSWNGMGNNSELGPLIYVSRQTVYVRG